MYFVISYDIPDDKRRTRIHKALKNFGERVQYSVFECNISKEHFLRLQHSLKQIIKEADCDSVRFYFLCDACKEKIERIGGIVPREEGPIVI